MVFQRSPCSCHPNGNWNKYLFCPKSDIYIPPMGCHKSAIVLRNEGKCTLLLVRHLPTKQCWYSASMMVSAFVNASSSSSARFRLANSSRILLDDQKNWRLSNVKTKVKETTFLVNRRTKTFLSRDTHKI